MDLVFNASNSVPDFVTVIAAEQCSRATALPGEAGFSCCIHRPLLTGAACPGEERLLLQATILGGSWGVPISSAGTAWDEWVPALVLLWPCSSARWCSRVHLTDGPPLPPRQGLLGLLSLPHWEQGAESDPAGSGPPSCRHAAARKEHGSVTRMCSWSHSGESEARDPVFVAVLFWQHFGWNLPLGWGSIPACTQAPRWIVVCRSCVHPGHSNFTSRALKGTD